MPKGNNDHKRLVRERMQLTGESYQTALRNVMRKIRGDESIDESIYRPIDDPIEDAKEEAIINSAMDKTTDWAYPSASADQDDWTVDEDGVYYERHHDGNYYQPGENGQLGRMLD